MLDNNNESRWLTNLQKLKTAIATISNQIGYLQLQGEHDENNVEQQVYVKVLKNRGMKYGEGSKAHYSDTNKGGDYHTDGAERPEPLPKYLPFMCIQQSLEGGDTVLKSAYTLHNNLLKYKPKILKRLTKSRPK